MSQTTWHEGAASAVLCAKNWVWKGEKNRHNALRFFGRSFFWAKLRYPTTQYDSNTVFSFEDKNSTWRFISELHVIQGEILQKNSRSFNLLKSSLFYIRNETLMSSVSDGRAIFSCLSMTSSPKLPRDWVSVFLSCLSRGPGFLRLFNARTHVDSNVGGYLVRGFSGHKLTDRARNRVRPRL